MTLKEQAVAANHFARQHARELAAELIGWQDTALLRDGKLRELAALCAYAGHSALSTAEHLATRAIFDSVDQSPSTAQPKGSAPLPPPRDEHIAYNNDFGALTAYKVGWMQGQQELLRSASQLSVQAPGPSVDPTERPLLQPEAAGAGEQTRPEFIRSAMGDVVFEGDDGYEELLADALTSRAPAQALEGERQAFEESARTFFDPDRAPEIAARDEGGNYVEWGVMLAWEVWQARAALAHRATAQAPEQPVNLAEPSVEKTESADAGPGNGGGQ